MTRRDGGPRTPWKPGLDMDRASANSRAVETVIERAMTRCVAMPRFDRTARLQDVFAALHEKGNGLNRDQELEIMEALDARP